MKAKCGFCGLGSLELKTRFRDIPYDDVILNVEEQLLECNHCQTQPSTSKLMKAHREAVKMAMHHHDQSKRPLC